MNIKVIRRENLRTLAKVAGGITRLADRLNKTQSQISHLIGSNPIKNIGDKIAAQAEEAFKKPPGWLDRKHISTREEFDLGPYHPIDENDPTGILCTQVPLLSWEEAKYWDQTAYNYRPLNGERMIPTTCAAGPFAFALCVHGDSMESASGVSFPEGSIIIADPDHVPHPGSFVVARVSNDRGATLKQLITQGAKRYLKPLNRRYPILEFTQHSVVLGVVKQMVIDFTSVRPRLLSQPRVSQRVLELG